MSEHPHHLPPRSVTSTVLVPFAIVTLIWGSTWLVIRDQVSVVPASWSACYRFVAAAAGMGVLALVRRERWTLGWKGIGFAATIGLFQFCLNFNFVYRAEQHITSGVVAVVFALLLVPNALLARIFLGQRLGVPLLIGSAIAMSGIALLFLHEARADPHGPASALLGVGLTMGGVLAASVSNVLQASDTARRYPMIPTLAAAMAIGALLDGTLAWTTAGPPVWEARPSYLLGILYLGLLGSTLTFPLYFHVIRTIGPAKAAYSSVIVPVIAMLLSTLFEGYRWTLLAGIGAALTAVGLVVALSARRPNR